MLHQRISATIGINSVFSEEVDIRQAKKVMLELPTFALGLITATANFYVLGAEDSSHAFRRIQEMGVYSASSGIFDWETPSGTGNKLINCRPALGVNFIQLETSNTATAALTCFVHVIR